MEQSNKKLIAAGIIEQEGKILIAQRSDKILGGKWELFEELSIQAEVGEYFCTSTFHHKGAVYDMCVFKVSAFEGKIKLNEHLAIAWVTPDELSNYTFPEPDLPIVEFLQKG